MKAGGWVELNAGRLGRFDHMSREIQRTGDGADTLTDHMKSTANLADYFHFHFTEVVKFGAASPSF